MKSNAERTFIPEGMSAREREERRGRKVAQAKGGQGYMKMENQQKLVSGAGGR